MTEAKSGSGVNQEGGADAPNQQQEPEPAQPESLIAITCHICGPGSLCHCEESEDDDYPDDDEDDQPRACYRCSGDGWQECPDPLQCTRRHNSLGECPCHSCGGSGDARDMTVW